MAFDVTAAKNAGYSDAEVADYLGQQSKFDVAGARKSGYSDAEIVSHLNAPQPSAPKPSLTQNITGFMANLNRGLGIGDELAAGIKTAKDVVTGNSGPNVFQTYKDELGGQRQQEDSFNADHPHVAALGRGIGMAATAVAPVGNTASVFAQGGKLGLNAATAANATRGATVAGLSAAGYAAADRGTLGERARAAADAANPIKDPVPFVIGGVGGALATPAAQKAPAPAMSLEQLGAAKDAAYKAVDSAGVKYTPEAFHDLTHNMASAMDEAGFNAGLHKKAATMIEQIGASDRGAGGMAPTLTQLDKLRQQIGRDVASSPDPGEARMGAVMREQIDHFINNAPPEALVGGGSPQDAAALVSQARDLNTRLSKAQEITDRLDSAELRASSTYAGGNQANATRQSLRPLIDPKSPQQMKNLTPEESTAIRQIVDGTAGANVARQAGKLMDPRGLIGATLLPVAGIPTHGLSTVSGPIGMAASHASNKLTAKAVQSAIDLISRGGTNRAVNIFASHLPGSGAAALSRAAGVAGASGQASARNAFARSANP